jgi:hypothetical protein
VSQRLTYLFALLGVLLSIDVVAQKLTASAPSQVQVGQRFRVTWELNTNGSNFTAPEITEFRVLGGPNQSTNMQYINGSMSQSVSYSYVLQAVKEGSFEIGPASMKANGSVVSSNSLTINVVKGQQQATGQQSTQQTQSTGSDNDLVARLEVSKRNA